MAGRGGITKYLYFKFDPYSKYLQFIKCHSESPFSPISYSAASYIYFLLFFLYQSQLRSTQGILFKFSVYISVSCKKVSSWRNGTVYDSPHLSSTLNSLHDIIRATYTTNFIKWIKRGVDLFYSLLHIVQYRKQHLFVMMKSTLSNGSIYKTNWLFLFLLLLFLCFRSSNSSVNFESFQRSSLRSSPM